jgi:hypothetical protein
MGSARSNPRDAAWLTALTCPIAVSLWSGRRGSLLATGGRTLPRRERRGSTSTAGFGRVRPRTLAGRASRSHACGMFVVSEAEAAAIRRGRCDPHRLRSRRYRPRRYRPPSSCAAPAVPRGGGQRTGAGMRPDHRRLEAAICAATAGQAGPRQAALADAMTANGSAPVEHDEEHGAGLGADAAWLGGPGACPRGHAHSRWAAGAWRLADETSLSSIRCLAWTQAAMQL